MALANVVIWARMPKTLLNVTRYAQSRIAPPKKSYPVLCKKVELNSCS